MKRILTSILIISILACSNKNNKKTNDIVDSTIENEKVSYYDLFYFINTNSGEYINIEINDNNNDTNLGYILYSDLNQDTILYNIEKIDEDTIYAKSYDDIILECSIPTKLDVINLRINGEEKEFTPINNKDIKIIEYSFFNTYKNNNEDNSFNYKNSIFILQDKSNNDIINKINININKDFNIKDFAIINPNAKNDNNLYQYIKRNMENEYNRWKNEEHMYDMEILANRYSIDYISDDIISINNFVYEYSGGAHGNYYTRYEVYSFKTGDKINIEDIILDVNDQNLISIIKQKLLSIRDNNLYFNLDDISLEGNNFYITYNGIVFTWGIYEIAPYSEGETRILLSKEEIESFLKEEYKSIIN